MTQTMKDAAVNTMKPWTLGRDEAKVDGESTLAELRERFPQWPAIMLDAYLNGVETGRMARDWSAR